MMLTGYKAVGAIVSTDRIDRLIADPSGLYAQASNDLKSINVTIAGLISTSKDARKIQALTNLSRLIDKELSKRRKGLDDSRTRLKFLLIGGGGLVAAYLLFIRK